MTNLYIYLLKLQFAAEKHTERDRHRNKKKYIISRSWVIPVKNLATNSLLWCLPSSLISHFKNTGFVLIFYHWILCLGYWVVVAVLVCFWWCSKGLLNLADSCLYVLSICLTCDLQLFCWCYCFAWVRFLSVWQQICSGFRRVGSGCMFLSGDVWVWGILYLYNSRDNRCFARISEINHFTSFRITVKIYRNADQKSRNSEWEIRELYK